MLKIWQLTILPILLLTAGCATKYQSENFFGFGFSEIKTSQDSFIVNFKGNASSHSANVLQYALRRASEVTLENGFTYFTIISKMNQSRIGGSNGSISTAPGISVQIQCTKEKTGNPNEVDAEFFLANNIK